MSKIVFIPGIKGSQLFEGQHKRWYPSTASDVDALVLDNHLTPGEPIRQVALPKLLKKVTVYKGILDEFSGQLEPFTYDWRKSILSHMEDLDSLLDTIEGPITLVAHSMGGLLLKAYVLQGASEENKSKIDKIITIGTPWHGSPFAYRVLRYGEPIFAEDDSLWAGLGLGYMERVAKLLGENYPSVYELMPSEAYYNMDGGKFATKDDGSVASWNDIMSSLSSSQNEYCSRYALPVQELMQQSITIPHFALIGHGYATLESIALTAGERKKFMKQHSEFCNGDFTVPLISARVPDAKEFFIKGRHSELCSMSETLSWIQWVLDGAIGNPPKGVTTEAPDAKHFSSKLVARIMCPVGFTVTDREGYSLAGDLDPEQVDFSKLEEYSNFYSHTVGEGKYLFFNDEDVENEIVIKAYDTGLANISIIPTHEPGQAAYFESVPVDPATILNLKLAMKTKSKPELMVSHSNGASTPVKAVPVQEADFEAPPFPKYVVNVEPAEGVQKNRRVKIHTYAGDVILSVTGEMEDIVEVFWSLDDGSLDRYESETILSLDTGVYVLHVVARDKWGRPLEPHSYVFRIDREGPKSIPIIEFHPEAGVRVGVRAESAVGIRVSRYQWIVPGKETHLHATTETAAGIFYTSINEVFGEDGSATLQFFSEDKFGRKESPRSVELSFRGLPELLWGDTVSAVTPMTIWRHMFQSKAFDGRVEVLTKGFLDFGGGDIIPDHVRAVKFTDSTLELIIYFSEQYTLYWSGPPREVIQTGMEYGFSFQLLTDYKISVTETNPKVKYYPYPLNKGNGTPVDVSPDENGVFHGAFTIRNDFPTSKVKLTVTDDRHKSPALRETILIVEDAE